MAPKSTHYTVHSLAKAVGAERFSTDVLPPNCLWAGARRAGIPHGRILAVHTAQAQSLPGVVAVLTGSHVPGSNLQGIVHKDQPVLATDTVRHAGDPVALVLATSPEALAQAVAAIEVELAPLPGVFDPAAALEPGAPLVHAGRPEGNLLAQGLMEKGQALEMLSQCEVVVEGGFSTPMQEHVSLETPNGLARRTARGGLDMVVSTQAPFRDRFEIGHALGLDPMAIRVRAPYLGGGFGGKDGATVQCLLALAALHAGGRWVKMVWSRGETFVAGYKRHAARIRVRLGAHRDGRLQALDCAMLFDAGPYAHLSMEIMALAMEHAAGPYAIPHTRVEGRCAYTNNPIGGAFRGFGVAQATFAMERAMDLLARRLAMDPAALRLRNALRPGQTNGVGVEMAPGPGPVQCLEEVMSHPLWTGREAWKAAAPAHKRRGVGLTACLNAMGYGRGLPDAAAAKLELTTAGTFRIYNAVPDMGQGNAAAFVAMGAQALGQPPEAFEIISPDTRRCLPAGSASASRTTYTFGNALLKACAAMVEKLKARAALFLLADQPHRLRLEVGAICDPLTGRRLPLERMAAMLQRDDRMCVDQFVMPVVEQPPDTGQEFRLGFPHRFFAHGACVCAVEADALTGQVEVVGCLTAVECGRVFDALGVERQIQGAAAQGLGFALMEELALHSGHLGAQGLDTYLIPTALDLPDLAGVAVDGHEPSGPLGLKGMGEVGVHGPAPAVAQALEDAVGLAIDHLPVEPEAVLAALGASS